MKLVKLAVLLEDRHHQFAGRAAAKIRRRLDAAANTPPSQRQPRKVAVSLPAVEWEALLREAGR